MREQAARSANPTEPASIPVPGLNGWGHDGITALWQNAQPRRVPARTQLVRQGSIGWQVPLLLSGYVRLSEITEFGDERLLDVVMAGECPLVLDALLERSPTASAETMGECVIAQLSPLAI